MAGELVTLALTAPVLQHGDVFEQAQAFEVTGPETAELAVELREGIKALIAEIDAGYRAHIKSAQATWSGLNAELKSRSDIPTKALALINEKLGRYELARREAEKAEERRLEATTPIDQPLPATVTPKATKGVSIALGYEAELTDLAALVRFALDNPPLMAVVLAPNYDGLNLLVKQQGEAFNVPGVKRVSKTPSVRSTRR